MRAQEALKWWYIVVHTKVGETATPRTRLTHCCFKRRVDGPLEVTSQSVQGFLSDVARQITQYLLAIAMTGQRNGISV